MPSKPERRLIPADQTNVDNIATAIAITNLVQARSSCIHRFVGIDSICVIYLSSKQLNLGFESLNSLRVFIFRRIVILARRLIPNTSLAGPLAITLDLGRPA